MNEDGATDSPDLPSTCGKFGFNRLFRIFLLYLLGILQGIAFVTVPAASNILTDPSYQNLSANEYGSLFLPMFIAAVLFAGFGGTFAKKFGIRALLLPGIACNTVAMSLLAASSAFASYHIITYIDLLVALFFLGAGFGATLTSLNALVAGEFPSKSATALTALHATLGIGTAIGPLLLAVSLEAEEWWLSPFVTAVVFTSVFFVVLLFSDMGAKSVESNLPFSPNGKKRIFPPYLIVFLAITFLYGICETVIGNWSPIYLKQVKGLSPARANDGLASFWFFVTLGRLSISALTNWVSFKWFHAFLPFFVFIGFLLIPTIHGPSSNILMFGLMGLACSAILPLNISYGEQTFPNYREVASGTLMSAYMAGYGIASYGSGSLQALGLLPLKSIFFISAIPAGLMLLLSFFANFLFRKEGSPDISFPKISN